MEENAHYLFAIAPYQGDINVPSSHLLSSLLQSTTAKATALTAMADWSQTNALFFSLRQACMAFDLVVQLHLQHWPQRFCTALCRAPKPPRSRPACDLLKRAQEQRLPFALSLPSLDYATSQMLERAACLHITFMQEWKPSRAAAVAAMRRCQTQAQAAALLGIRQQSISEALHAAHFKMLLQFEETVRQRLRPVQA